MAASPAIVEVIAQGLAIAKLTAGAHANPTLISIARNNRTGAMRIGSTASSGK
jgi:hypothetical protein